MERLWVLQTPPVLCHLHTRPSFTWYLIVFIPHLGFVTWACHLKFRSWNFFSFTIIIDRPISLPDLVPWPDKQNHPPSCRQTLSGGPGRPHGWMIKWALHSWSRILILDHIQIHPAKLDESSGGSQRICGEFGKNLSSKNQVEDERIWNQLAKKSERSKNEMEDRRISSRSCEKLGRRIKWKMEEESICNRSWGRTNEVEESSRRLQNLWSKLRRTLRSRSQVEEGRGKRAFLWVVIAFTLWVRSQQQQFLLLLLGIRSSWRLNSSRIHHIVEVRLSGLMLRENFGAARSICKV